jgi:uncharacterized membrane protein YkvA (DUF1232 family)
MNRNRRILAAVLVAAGAVVYGLSPIDIIPELLTGPFGLVDDLGVLGGAAFAIWKLLGSRKQADPGTTPPAA